MFFMMFVLSAPAMLFFFHGSELESTTFGKVVSATSLGNLGSSEPVCREGIYDLVTEEAAARPKGVI